MIKELVALLHNQMIGGGLLLMGTGSIIALFRNIPRLLWEKFKSQLIVSVSVTAQDPLFEWITIWLADHPYSKKTRRLLAKTKDNSYRSADCKKEAIVAGRSGDDAVLPEIIYSPSKGEHFFFYQGKFIWLSRGKEGEEDGKAPVANSSAENKFMNRLVPEQYTFRTIGRSQQQVRNLVNDVLKHTAKERQEKTRVYYSQGNWWDKLFSYTPRPLASVFLDGSKKEEILEDMVNFMGEREWYTRRGVPYSRKYLFHGPPGNGKTSIIGALAGELGMNLYILNLSDNNMNDSYMASLVRDVRPRSLLLLEDVDAALSARKGIARESSGQAATTTPVARRANGACDDVAETKKEEKGITLSGLLNILDGVLTPDGIMVVMTTNRIGALDPAMVRPGRVDMKVEFNFATRDQMIKSFVWFYPDKSEQDARDFVDQFVGTVSMATVQQKLIELKSKEKALPAMATGD